MKRERVTIELILDIPAGSNASKFVKVTGGNSVSKRSVKVIKTEDIPDELLNHEHRRAEIKAVRKILNDLLEKLDLNKKVYVAVSNRWKTYLKTTSEVTGMNIVFNNRWDAYCGGPLYLCADLESRIYYSREHMNYGPAHGKSVATLADPELKELANIIVKQFKPRQELITSTTGTTYESWATSLSSKEKNALDHAFGCLAKLVGKKCDCPSCSK